MLALAGMALVLGLAALRLADPLPLRVMRESTFDLYQRLAPRPDETFPVLVVDIDDRSLAAHGQWPWRRDILARLADRLTELGAATVAFDILFPEPDRLSPSRLLEGTGEVAPDALPDTDAIFAATLARGPTVLGFKDSPGGALERRPKAGVAISGADPTPALPVMTGAVMPIAPLADAAAGLGSLSLNATDSIEIVRRVPLLWSGPEGLYPTLSVEALRVAFGAQTLLVLGELEAGYMEGLRIGPLTVPTTPSGDLVLYFRRPGGIAQLSAAELLGDGYRALRPQIAGAIVLVGTSASGLGDIRGTPLGINVPGVTLHAQAIEQMLGQRFLFRTDWVTALEQYGFVLLGLALVLIVARAGPLLGLFAGLVSVGGVVALSWMLFGEQGLLIDPSFLLIGSVLLYAAMVFLRFLTTDRDKRQIRRAFSHYVAPELLLEIERNAGRLELGGEMRDLSVMFTDMRGFTALSEKVEPTALVRLLNRVFGALGAEITARSGTIDKFVGDAIMAFWNAPLDVPTHALKACEAALAMRRRLAALNGTEAFRAEMPPEFAATGLLMGIGIASGPALVGNMGLESRFDYSCIGDTVNLASRIEGASKTVGFDILVNEATRAACTTLAFLAAGAIALKGKREAVPIFILVGGEETRASPAFAALARLHEAALLALARGESGEPEVAACRAAAEPVEPQLVPFYDRMAARRADFLPQGLRLAAD